METFGTTPAQWDELYGRHADAAVGEPNEVLVTLASGLARGRALDVCCGHGAEATWLARRGWDVTAIDVSQVALDRAEAAAKQAGVQVDWRCGALETAELPAYDLVTTFYPALHRSPGDDALCALLARVAPGGTLLVVHHADPDVEKAKSFGFDPEHYVSHQDVVAALNQDWDVDVVRQRPRKVAADRPVPMHPFDDVLFARRIR